MMIRGLQDDDDEDDRFSNGLKYEGECTMVQKWYQYTKVNVDGTKSTPKSPSDQLYL